MVTHGSILSSGLTTSYVHALLAYGNRIYAGTQEGVFISSDGGNNWIKSGLTSANVQSLSIVGGRIFAGTTTSVFVTGDLGITWTPYSNGLPSGYNISLAFLNNQAFVGTLGKGIWTVPLSQIPVATEEVQIGNTTKYELYQNAPNPVQQNANTKITFETVTYGHVNLELFDLNGKSMGILVDEYLQPGTYATDLSTENMTTGIYFYKFKTGNFTKTRKLIVQ